MLTSIDKTYFCFFYFVYYDMNENNQLGVSYEEETINENRSKDTLVTIL